MILLALSLAFTPTPHLAALICTWPVERLADLPEFRQWGENKADRMVRASIEKENDCD